jgi:DNA-directed RNA polymerase subunit RPC12/RpoP
VWRKGLDSAGARAVNPHLHLIVWGCGGITREWVLRAWREVTGRLETTQVDVDAVRDRRQALRYVARYSSRDERGRALDYVTYSAESGSVGRFWGVFNRRGLPVAVKVEVLMECGAAFYRLKRSARRVWRGVNRCGYCGFRLFVGEAGVWAALGVWYASDGAVWERADLWGAQCCRVQASGRP